MIKNKSAHDCLEDSLLSREEAVKANELEDYTAPEVCKNKLEILLF